MTDSNPPDDPFAEFEDWLNEDLHFDLSSNSFFRWTSSQPKWKQVEANARLLLDRDEWSKKVERFENAIKTLNDPSDQQKLRKKYVVRFDGYNFKNERIEFSNYFFPFLISFQEAKFNSIHTSFDGCIFAQGAIFDNSIFEGAVSFDRIQCHQASFSFNGVLVKGDTFSLSNSTFRDGRAVFDNTVFLGRAGFTDVDFGSQNASFLATKFEVGPVYFCRSIFGAEGVGFDLAEFGPGGINFDGIVSRAFFLMFSGAKLDSGDVTFQSADLENSSLFLIGLNIDGDLNCRMMKAGNVQFEGTSVSGIFDLQDSSFRSVPDFRQMKLDRAPEVARMTVPPPRMTGWWPFSKAKDQQDVLKFRKLKAMAIEANDHEKDGEFFAYEMLAKRGWETRGVIELTANWLYWVLSNYGRSFLVPLCWMAVSFVGFAACYAWWLQRYVALPDAMHFTWLFSIKNSIPFLGSLFRFAPVPDGHESRFDTIYEAASGAGLNVDALVWTGVTQSLVGGVFFFFLLLGLRNKFRLK